MKVLAIWLLCSVPLILAVLNAVKAASSDSGFVQPETALALPQTGSARALLDSVDESLAPKLIRFSWFSLPALDDTVIAVRTASAVECREIQVASERLMTLNRGLRSVIRGFENPQLRQKDLELFAQAVPSTDPDLDALERLPVADSVRLCVATVVNQRIAAKAHNELRKAAQENFRKARSELTVAGLDKMVAAIESIPASELTEEDREQLRWSRFWKYWLSAQPSRPAGDLAAMRTRKTKLEQLLKDADEESLSPIKPDEVRLVEACRVEVETLATQVRLGEIKEQIQTGLPESWLDNAENMLSKLSEADSQLLLKLVRESLLKRVLLTDVPVAQFEEAVTKNGELWIGTFELKNGDKPKPYYNFESTSGQKKTYCYLSSFSEPRREPFAVMAYKRMSEARSALQAAPQKRESWLMLHNEVISLQQGKERYLKLTMVETLADSRLVLQSVSTLKLDELRSVCEEVLSDSLWPRIERLLSGKP